MCGSNLFLKIARYHYNNIISESENFAKFSTRDFPPHIPFSWVLVFKITQNCQNLYPINLNWKQKSLKLVYANIIATLTKVLIIMECYNITMPSYIWTEWEGVTVEPLIKDSLRRGKPL